MKNFILTLLLIAVLVCFGYCFLLAGQNIITIFTALTTHANRVDTGCFVTGDGSYLTCRF